MRRYSSSANDHGSPIRRRVRRWRNDRRGPRHALFLLIGAGISAAAVHCGSTGATGATGSPGESSYANVTPVPSGTECAAGGFEVQTESNDGGVTTNYVCNGVSSDGGVAPTVTVTPIDAGTQCPAGGYEVTVGTTTSYVCNGAPAIPDAAPPPKTDAGGPQPVAVAAGAIHTCALLSDGSVWCWGDDLIDELGPNGGGSGSCLIFETCSLTPVAVPLPSPATAIAAGEYGSSCALLSNGTVWCWGDNSFGELGTTAVAMGGQSANPVQVQLPASNPATAITVGYDHACALLADTSVWCWGGNENGQLQNGTATNSPVPVESEQGEGATAVVAGDQFTCVLWPQELHGGNVVCWGSSSMEQFAVELMGVNFTSIVAAGEHVCVTLAPNQGCYDNLCDSVMCFGDNSQGALGIGSTAAETENNFGTPVGGLPNASLLAAGTETSCAVVAPGGALACWGDNGNGQLGNGTTTSSSTPVLVDGLAQVTAVSSGGPGGAPNGTTGVPYVGPELGHTCAISHGEIWCWGDNEAGQLGNGTVIQALTPVPVAWGATSVVVIDAGVGDAGQDAGTDAAAAGPCPDSNCATFPDEGYGVACCAGAATDGGFACRAVVNGGTSPCSDGCGLSGAACCPGNSCIQGGGGGGGTCNGSTCN